MNRLSGLWRRLRYLLGRRRFDADLAREVQAHLELAAEDRETEGQSLAAARLAARRRFGNPTWLVESSREAWGWGWLDRLGQDLRGAFRSVGRNRAFTAVAVLVLALGIGVNTIIFSVANALIFNPFPYPDAARLVAIDVRSGSDSWYSTVPLGDFFAWRAHNRTFAAMAAYGTSRVTVSGAPSDGFEGPERLIAGRATASFLRVLGIAAARGRFFNEGEDRPDAGGVVLLSHGTWLRRFGGRDDAVGRVLVIGDRPHTIVGVMPARLPLPGSEPCDLWIPAAYETVYADTTRWDGDRMIARLRPGATQQSAESELRAIRRQREQQDGSLRPGLMARVRPIGGDVADNLRLGLRALAGAVGFVLLLACVNLAGLLLARGTARGHEMAVRAALGASRWRLVRQVLVETVLLGLAGGTLALLFARWGIGAVAAAAPPHLGFQSALRLDGVVFGFTAAVSVATGILFGLVPAAHGSASTRLAAALQGSRTTTGPRRAHRTLAVLVVTEIALAVVLLTGGGLMLKSFVGLLRVDTGIRTDNLLTFEIALPRARYGTAGALTSLYAALLQRLRTTPGVVDAGLVNPLPMSRQFSGGGFQIDNQPRATKGERGAHAQYLAASAGYFAAAGIPVAVGREFTEADGAGAPSVALVNAAFARLHLANEDPLTHTVNGARIIGVVGDIRHNGPAFPADAQIYTPLAQDPSSLVGVVVRTGGDPRAMARSVRAAILATDRLLPWDRVRTMEQAVSASMAEWRMVSAMVCGFAAFALVLAAIGVYGVIAFSVGQRAHEIGVRVALGALPHSVVNLVLAQGLRLALAGALLGIPVAVATSRLLESLLVGVSPHDPTVLLLVPLGLLAVALAASYLPARRATKVDPLVVLRSE